MTYDPAYVLRSLPEELDTYDGVRAYSGLGPGG